MTDLRKAAEKVLQAWDKWKCGPFEYEMEGLRQALAQPEQEPVAHLWECIGRWTAMIAHDGEDANLAPPDWLVDAVKAATAPVDAVNMSQERVDETEKRGHEPYDQTALELCEKCGWKAVIPNEGCLVCARNEQEPEPRGHCTCGDPTLLGYVHFRTRPCIYYTAPYTKTDSPDRVLHKEWVGLTDEEIWEGLSLFNEYGDLNGFSFAQWAEAKLKEKNT
jgi:hypothetical protein